MPAAMCAPVRVTHSKILANCGRRGVRDAAVRAVVEPPAATSIPFDKNSDHLETWQPNSWREREALQQPLYPDENDLKEAVDIIKSMPPLVFAGECRLLQYRMAAAAEGKAFVLFGAL
jgi:Class-II DAHP synthetase family